MTRRFRRHRAGPGRPRTAAGRDRGSAAAELVIITPVLIVVLLLVVALGRYAYGRQLVEQAAAAAARVGSLAATAGQAQDTGRRAAEQSLRDAGVSCASMTAAVDAAQFRPGGTVQVTVTCRTDLSGLVLAGVPGSVTLTATGNAPLETFRDFTGATADPGRTP